MATTGQPSTNGAIPPPPPRIQQGTDRSSSSAQVITNPDGSVSGAPGSSDDPAVIAKAKADAASVAPPVSPYDTGPGSTFDTGDPGDLTKTSGRDFIYGRTPDYVRDTTAAERATSGANAAKLSVDAAAANRAGAELGTGLTAYGQQQASIGHSAAGTSAAMAGHLAGQATATQAAGAALQDRAGAQANYTGSDASLDNATGRAADLAAIEATQGPSGAQAQLQSGINASEASNLAMARSGRGWGGSATALSQAANANAAATQNAANSSAQLSASENAAYRQRQAANLGAAAGIDTGAASQLGQQELSQAQLAQQTTAENDQAHAALNAQGLTAYGQAMGGSTAAGQLGVQAGALGVQAGQAGAGIQQQGETLGMQGTQGAQSAYAQGEQMAGINESAQQSADLAREGDIQQQYGIQSGVAIQNQAATNSGWGTALSTAAAIGGMALMASDIHAKDGVLPLDQSTAGTVSPSANAGRSAAAGSDAAMNNAGRTAAAGNDSAADTKAQAQQAAAMSMGIGAIKSDLSQFGANPGIGAYQQQAAMGRPTAMYGAAAPQWGQMQPGQITSDEDEKTGVRVMPTADSRGSEQRAGYEFSRALHDSVHPNVTFKRTPKGQEYPASDMRSKDGIEAHGSDALDMVDQAPGYSYFYKNPERHGAGEHFGPMAQDLQKTPAGASTVERAPDGTLAVNTGRLALVQHAAMHSMRQENAAKFDQLKSEIDALKNRKAS